MWISKRTWLAAFPKFIWPQNTFWIVHRITSCVFFWTWCEKCCPSGIFGYVALPPGHVWKYDCPSGSWERPIQENLFRANTKWANIFPLLQVTKWSQQWSKGLSHFFSPMMFRYSPQFSETLRNYCSENTMRNKLPGRRKNWRYYVVGWAESSMLSPFVKLNISVYMMENLCWFILIKALASSSEKLYRDLGENSTGGNFLLGAGGGETVFSLYWGLLC